MMAMRKITAAAAAACCCGCLFSMLLLLLQQQCCCWRCSRCLLIFMVVAVVLPPIGTNSTDPCIFSTTVQRLFKCRCRRRSCIVLQSEMLQALQTWTRDLPLVCLNPIAPNQSSFCRTTRAHQYYRGLNNYQYYSGGGGVLVGTIV